MTFTEKLVYLMNKNGIKNRSQLSKQSGIPYTTIIGFFEKGTENIRRTTLIKLSDFFDCSLEYLVSDEINDENYGKNDNFKINSNEILHIQKYRNLDEYGKKAIDTLLKIECERCASEEKTKWNLTPLYIKTQIVAICGLCEDKFYFLHSYSIHNLYVFTKNFAAFTFKTFN